ncbi:MAG: hypothetical protein ACJ78U_03870, partial [Myxococcales bacterium]
MKSHTPERQTRLPFEGDVQEVQLGPQLSTLSGRHSVPHLWNVAAHRKTHFEATQPASVPGGASAVQSTQTFTPQSSGVFAHVPEITTSAARGASGSSATSFEPAPQPTDT